MQEIGHRPNFSAGSPDQFSRFGNGASMVRIRFVKKGANLAQCQAQAGNIGSDSIMDFPSYPAPFFVLRPKKQARQLPHRNFGGLSFGDIADYPDDVTLISVDE